jgi:hypothetical protein
MTADKRPRKPRKDPGSTRGPRRSREQIVDDEQWDSPTQEQLTALTDDSGFLLYSKRKRAVELYRQPAISGETIKAETGLELWQASRLHEAGKKFNPDTHRPTGYYACLPGYARRGVQHARRAEFNAELAKLGQGLKGILDYFLALHDDIATKLEYYLRTRKVSRDAPPEPCISSGSVVDAFYFFCREKGLDKLEDRWPFDRDYRGAGAVREYYKKWKAKNPALAALNELGVDAAREQKVDAAVAVNREQLPEALPMVFSRVEADGQLLHAIGEVSFVNKYGVEVHVELRRLYALVMVDTTLPLVLAARLSFGLRYDANDVLGLVRDALFPRRRRERLSIDHPQYRYLDGADFPANTPIGKDLRGNGWQELAWDADKSQISAAQQRQIRQLLRCKVASERVGNPTARAFIERFNKYLAKAFEILASGTGSHPRDPARNEPEKAARKYRIRIELLEELLDLFVRNWNATYRPELGATPLEALGQLIGQNRVFYNSLQALDPEQREGGAYSEFFPSFRRQLRRSRKTHGVLVVNLFGAKYSEKALVNNKLLLSTTNLGCTVYVNPDDAREAWLVPDAYPEMRIYIYVQNRALRAFKHSLHWRMVTSAFVTSMGHRSRALTPDMMRAAAAGLGEQAAAGNPSARAAFSTILGEQARIDSGAVPDFGAQEFVSAPVIDESEAMEVEPDPEHLVDATAAPAAPTSASARPGRPARATPAAQPPPAPPLARRVGRPLIRPPVPGDRLGIGRT